MRSETIEPFDLKWTEEDAKVYRCPSCGKNLFTVYRGTAEAFVTCQGWSQAHVVTWPDEVSEKVVDAAEKQA